MRRCWEACVCLLSVGFLRENQCVIWAVNKSLLPQGFYFPETSASRITCSVQKGKGECRATGCHPHIPVMLFANLFQAHEQQLWRTVQIVSMLIKAAYREQPRLTMQWQKNTVHHSRGGQAGVDFNGSIHVTSGDPASRLSSKSSSGSAQHLASRERDKNTAAIVSLWSTRMFLFSPLFFSFYYLFIATANNKSGAFL